MRLKLKHLWWLVALLILAAYLWNAYRYSVWSSYDGGGHLAYAVQLGEGRGLPDQKTNYLAWHEPGYYWLLGTGTHTLGFLDWPKPELYKLWQYSSALIMWSGSVAAGFIAWQINQRRNAAWLTGIATASLFCWSALARYVTNEGMFQAGVLWWLVWFMWWRMDEPPQWSRAKWLVLGFGLAGLMWIKLTTIVLLLAVIVWLLMQTGVRLKIRLQWAVLLLVLVSGLYAPWLYHKNSVYGQALTINNYEQSSKYMPWQFFVAWDNTILSTPFWISGRGSFASMLTASALVDYDNIFEAYDRSQVTDLVTGNGRRLNTAVALASVQLMRWSAGLVLWLVVGFALLTWQWVRGRLAPRVQLLVIVAVGFLAALMYNVWKYPFLDRGTLKAIFIAAAFPLAAIAASSAWQQIWPNRSRWMTALIGMYWLVWLLLSWRIGLLPW